LVVKGLPSAFGLLFDWALLAGTWPGPRYYLVMMFSDPRLAYLGCACHVLVLAVLPGSARPLVQVDRTQELSSASKRIYQLHCELI